MHGGPGSGSNPLYRGFFDPCVYKIIQMDQRGSGKSTPSGGISLEENNTWGIVDDMEKLRIHLKISKWHTIIGGSWGSCISIAYSESYPNNVQHLIVIGIFLGRPIESQFACGNNGASWFYPDFYKELVDLLPEVQRDDVLRNYYRVIVGDDKVEALKYSKMWLKYEMLCTKLITSKEEIEEYINNPLNNEKILAKARIETHYFVNGCFFNSNSQLISDAYKIRDIPTSIINGRYDLVTPLKSAYDLWSIGYLKKADLYIIDNAGHSGSEIKIIDMIIKCTEKYKTDL